MNDLLQTNRILVIAVGTALVIVLAVILFLFHRRRQKLNVQKFTEKWKDAQKFCSSKETWHLAIIEADKLLEEALKKRRFRGRSMGERLVAAQRQLSDNDGVWFGHKLRNKIVQDDLKKLKKRDVQDALVGIRQALRDLGALE